MTSGAVYEVTDTNGVVIAFWVPSAGLTICDQIDMSGNIYYSISNRDTNETVYAVRQR